MIKPTNISSVKNCKFEIVKYQIILDKKGMFRGSAFAKPKLIVIIDEKRFGSSAGEET